MIPPLSFRSVAFPMVVACATALAQDDYQPNIAGASKDAELALNGFVLPDGVTGSLLAAEPMVANHVL